MTKTNKDNDVIEHICLVYMETKIKLFGITSLGVVCDEN